MANVKVYSKSKHGNTNIVPNFKIREFASKDGANTIKIDLELAFILQAIRNICGSTVINSGYRTASHNKRVGGASNSYHLYGRAADIKCSNANLDTICNVANSLGVLGIIKYPTFVHIDTRISKYHANNKGTRLSYGRNAIVYGGAVLKSGSTGWQVGIVQFKLARLGYSSVGTVDGKAGAKFDKAVREFQAKNGLVVDGKVGTNTWAKLFN